MRHPLAPPRLNVVQLLPNLLTVTALCAGLTAIRFALSGDYAVSVALIVLAAVLDGLDGRLARMLRSESAIGAELDSLCDFVNFGVAPALTVYLWGMQSAQGPGWIAVLIYAVSCLLRLARFNVDSRDDSICTDKTYFTGVPSPAGALLVLLPVHIAFILPTAPLLPPIAVAVYMGAIGALMISRMPVPSLKSAQFPVSAVRLVVVGFVALVAALVTYPWVTLAGLDLAYLAFLAIAWQRRRFGTTEKEL